MLRWRKNALFIMLYNSVYVQHCTAQWAVVIGFVVVRLHPRTDPSLSDGRSSQNGGSTDSFRQCPLNIRDFNIGPMTHCVERLCQTVGGTPFCEDLPSLGLDPVLE